MADRRTIRTVVICLSAILCALQIPPLNAQSPAQSLTISANPRPTYAGQPVLITVTPSRPAVNEIYTFQWGDGTPNTPSNTPQTRHIYASAGTYRIAVQVRSTGNVRQDPINASMTLVVSARPVAQLSENVGPGQTPAKVATQTPLQITLRANPQPAYAGQLVQIIVTPNQPISNVAYTFQWGDGTANTSTSVPQTSHTYASAGTYRIIVQVRPAGVATMAYRAQPPTSNLTLTVLAPPAAQTPKGNGQTQTPVQNPSQPPLQIALNANPRPTYTGQPVLVTVTPNHPINAAYTYQWGDRTPDTSSRAPQASHTYASPGVYRVIVQVSTIATYRQEPTSSALTLVVIAPQSSVQTPVKGGGPVQLSLQITLSANPREPYAGKPVLVTANLSYPISDATYFFQWGDRTDDTPSRTPQAVHTYASPGTYRVTVGLRTTTNFKQKPISSDLTLVVTTPPTQVIPKTPQPALQITLNSFPSAPYAGQLDRITATPSYPTSNARYLFDWGDRTPSTPSSNPQAPHVFANPGTYNVVVQVSALANDRDVAARNILTIVVNPPPPPPPPPPNHETTPTTPPTNTTPTTPPTNTTPTNTTPAPNPTLTLTTSQTHSLPGQPLTFTVASDPPTGFTQFQYQFGDIEGPGIPGPNGVQHAYTQPGTYYARATTQSADGRSTLTSNDVQIRIDPAALPELTLAVLTANPVAKAPTVVDASLDPRVPEETFRFDWGDGTPADSVEIIGHASHVYSNPGTYTLSVIAITNGGNVPGQKTITEGTPPTPPLPRKTTIIIAVLFAAALAGWAIHHFKTPTGELHTTFGVSHTAANVISIPASAPHLALTFKSGAEVPEHNIRFL